MPTAFMAGKPPLLSFRSGARGLKLVNQMAKWIKTFALVTALSAIAAGASSDRSFTPLKVDRILIIKNTRTMMLMSGKQVLKSYKVALGAEPIGAKQQEGDHKTPEGDYVIDSKNPGSRFHLALHISYPNPRDRERARKLGVNLGGAIMIHGLERKYAWLGSLHRRTDWTDGCIAVTNYEIEEIWRLVSIGTAVEIRAS